MRLIRRPAYQGHAVPQTAHAARGPFPAELFSGMPIEAVEDDTPDLLENAQNGYRAPRLMRCMGCNEVMAEDETDAHRCG